MKRTAQLLEDLLAPAPAPNDPEAFDALDDGAVLLQSDEEDVQGRPLKVKREEPLRRAELDMDDVAYAARKVQRRDLQNGEAEMSNSGDEAGENDDSESDAGQSESGGDGDSFDESGGEGDSLNMSDGEDENGVPSAAVFAAADQGHEEDEGWRQLEEEFAALQSRSAKASNLSAKGPRSRKAAAVETQTKLWNTALATRIVLQRSLVAADRLPRGDAHACVMQHVPEATDAMTAARKAAIDVLGDCMDSMHELMSRVAPHADGLSAERAPSTVHDAETLVKREGQACSALWPQVKQLESSFCSFRDNELDRWHRKTMLATGQTALKGVGGLQALNKPLSQQVGDVLAHPERALRKLRRQRQTHDRVLCEGSLHLPEADTSAAQARATGGDSVDTHVNVRRADWVGSDADFKGVGREHRTVAPAAAAGGAEEAQHRRATVAEAPAVSAADEESYDDSAFYQVLLQEFLESSQAKDLMAGSLKMPKHRKLVDRRASKGRKIRFNVMDKLVNFMDPVHVFEDEEGRIQSLYGNLFGHATR